MKLRIHNSPYIRYRESSRTVMSDTIISLIPLFFMAFFYYGYRVLIIGAAAVLACTLSDWICQLLQYQRVNLRDLSPIVTGMIIALLMPAAIDLPIVVLAGMFAIFIAKAPFGGTGNNLFNPAAAGLAFAHIAWPVKMLAYTEPLTLLSYQIDSATKFVQGPAATLRLDGTPAIGKIELLLGNFPGPLGSNNTVIILACFAFLLIRGCVKWYVPVAYLASASFLPFFLHSTSFSGLDSIFFELSSASLLFIAVFMVSEPATLPKRNLARFLYAFTAGLVTMLFRYFGTMEQSAVFALLLMNGISPQFDMIYEWAYSKERRKQLEA